MTPDRWLTLLGISVALLGICVPVLLFFLGRVLSKLDSRDAEIKVLTAANVDRKIENAELRSTLRVVDRTLSALPIAAAPPEGHGT
jgi:hypothetical protein